MPTLETDRLLLRSFVEDDLDDYHATFVDEEVVRYLGSGPMTRPEAWRSMAYHLGHEALRGWGNGAVVVKATGQLVGRCGLYQPEGWPGLEVGWALARPAWGQGYATEAAIAWRDWAFAELDAPELISVIHVDNDRSAAVARRIGHEPGEEVEVLGHPCRLWKQPFAGR